MGVFGKNKKAKDGEFYIPEDIGESSMSKMSRSLKRKPKNAVVQKPEVNLTTALPDTNDFRTSLLMPQLSARFSMLREQDDPTTKVGKANDDSVLFPKRASRLNLFAHNPLTDISEVQSIHTSIRPPFARGDRSYSLSDGYASDDGGSILSRSKPNEGNNLFGGRQKIYRVPAGGESDKTLTEADPQASGLRKHVYGDDMSMSLFQKYRQQVREEDSRQSATSDEQEETDAVSSPMTAFSKSRGTTSSTASGPSNRRTSTAATSVASESPIPKQTSHGIGYRTHRSDSANGSDESLVKRNPSFEIRKNLTPRDHAQPPVPSLDKSLSQSRGAVQLSDKHFRTGMSSTGAYRAVSPPPMSNPQAIASLDLGLQDTNHRVASPTRRYQTSSPSSPEPFEGETDHVYSSSLQPNDHGKATAMGLFNRPQQQFDEQQFLQRQRQMLDGRSSPFPAESRSESRASPEPISAMGRIDAALAKDRESSAPLHPNSHNLGGATTSPPQPRGLRNFSSPNKTELVGTRARNTSSASPGPESTQVKARVESLIRRQNAELAALEVERSVVTDSYSGRKASLGSDNVHQSSRGTFLNTFDASDDESDRSPQKEVQPRLPPLDVHPALRDGIHDFDFGDNVSLTPRINVRESNTSTTSNARTAIETSLVGDTSQRPSQPKGGDSPTLGPNGLGLSGMIRSHLRHDSDRSSVYPPSPGVSNFPHREVSMASTTHTINPPESIHSDPWEFDSVTRNQKSQPESRVPSDATPTMSQKAQQILGHVQRQPATSKAQQILGQDAPNASNEAVNPHSWQDELAAHHRRGESTETQKERQDFDRDLADRQKKIQERLKGKAELELRSRSPVERQERPNFPAQAFHALKQKTSMGSMAPPERPNAQPKAMKMLGISPQEDTSMRSATPTRAYDVDPRHERQPPRRQPPQRPPPPVDPGYDNGRRTPADGKPPMDSGFPSGRRTPADGRHAMDSGYASGRRTPADGRPPMDSAYASGRRTPADRRPPPPHHNGSYEDFEHQRQPPPISNSGRLRRDRGNSSAADAPRSHQGYHRDEHGYAPGYERHGQPPSPPEMRTRRGAPPTDPYERSASAMSSRPRNGSRPPQPGYYDDRIRPSQGPVPHQMNLPPGGGPPRPSPRPPFQPSPVSSFQAPSAPPSAPYANPNSTSNSARSSPVLASHPVPADERSNLPAATRRDRKRSVTRGMISEPMFVSSTSSVPLVDLPNGAASPRPNPISSPPVPAMNPRRRGNTNDNYGTSYSAQPSPSMPMSPIPVNEGPHAQSIQHPHQSQYARAAAQYAYGQDSDPSYIDQGSRGKPPPRARNRLRKISSEGGNMASRARQQAFMDEMGREKENSPRVPIFPNRSATSLGMAEHQGGMF